jgi:anti-sigma factor RsiW
MHLDEGRMQALLDGELPGDEERLARSHLASCASCRHLLDEAGHRMALVAGALGVLDVPVPLLPAREAVRRRIDPRAGAAPRGSTGDRRQYRHDSRWLRAAAVVLVAAGVGASALPGSPVREWLTRAWPGTPGPVAPAAAPEALSGATPSETPEVAVFLTPNAGQVRVDLAGLPPGSVVRVEMVHGEAAAVFAPDGSRFETAPGRLHASIEGDRVRVEFPRGVPWAVLWVNGERYLTRSGDRLEVQGPGSMLPGDTILFRVPEPGTRAPSRP